MKKTSIITSILAILALAGCNKHISTKDDPADTKTASQQTLAVKKPDLNQESADFVDLAIAIYCKTRIEEIGPRFFEHIEFHSYTGKTMSASSDFTGSTKFSKALVDRLLPYHAEAWEFASYDTSGGPGAKHKMHNGGDITCKSIGQSKHNIVFRDGEIGIENGEVYITPATKMTFDSESYVFKDGAWRPDPQAKQLPPSIGASAKFTGVLTLEMVPGRGGYLKRLQTTSGAYQFITSDDYQASTGKKTIYKGMEITADGGVRWMLGKKYEITGEFPATIEPSAQLDKVRGIIDARVVELLKEP